MKTLQLKELILQSLEHERGGIEVYSTALSCALNPQLKAEWQKYLEQTRTHVATLENVCQQLQLDPTEETPGRAVVRLLGKSLVDAMKLALATAEPAAAELVACECVVFAETKDHMDWELIGKCADQLSGAEKAALDSAYDVVEDQEDEHLYHSRGWCRELWIQSLGMNAILPPPEELQKVSTAIGAAKAEQTADKMR